MGRALSGGPHGEGRIELNGPVEVTAEIWSVIDSQTKAIFDAARRCGVRESRDAYAADAVLAMARRARASASGILGPVDQTSLIAAGPMTAARPQLVGQLGLEGVAGDEAASAEGTAATEEAAAMAAALAGTGPVGRGELILVADYEAFRRGFTDPGETCEIPGLGPVPVSVAREWLGDALLAIVLKRGEQICNVTHVGRHIPATLRTALLVADPVCVVPGCNRRAGQEIDHTTSATGFADTGVTEWKDLARPCDYHHYLKTHKGFRLEGNRDTGFTWIPPPEPEPPLRE